MIFIILHSLASMKIKSYIQTPNGLQKIDVEVLLLPGLPQIHFLGQADSQIKESAARIKSAIKMSGYQFPTSQQILVDLRPHSIKKSSLGLELAVVYGLLCETGQIAKAFPSDEFVVYGELGLNGEVYEPSDLSFHVEENESVVVFTGARSPQLERPAFFSRRVVSHLKRLENPEYIPVNRESYMMTRPEEFLEVRFSAEEALLIRLLSIGEHSLFLAGPAGSGKTTLARSLSGFLPEPRLDRDMDYQRRKNILENRWRPVLMPHHSATPISLIGGGDPLFVGEITRAHGGILILDEYLEFHEKVQESLRGPLQEKKIRLSRGRNSQEFPCDVLVVATTNLCPCGRWAPGKSMQCFHSLKKCRSVLDRLSGPVLDRFEILYYKNSRGGEEQTGREILEELKDIWKFRRELKVLKINRSALEHFDMCFAEPLWSERRKKACLRVAHSLAWVEKSSELKPEHIERAFEWTCRNFLQLQKGIG